MNINTEEVNIRLVDDYFKVRRDNVNLLIYPDKPAWVCLNDKELEVYVELLSQSRIYKHNDLISLRNQNSTRSKVIEKIINNEFVRNPVPEDGDEHKYSHYSVHLIATHQCNMRCKHCYMEAGDKLNGEISFEQLTSFFQLLMDEVQKPLDIILSGGEILTVPWLQDFLSWLRKNSCVADIYTNGKLLRAELLSDFRDVIGKIQLSCEGINEKSYEYIRGRGNYKHFLESIKLLASHNIPTTLAYLIMPHNFEEMKHDLVTFLENYYFDNLSLKMDPDFDWEGRAIKELDRSHSEKFYEHCVGDIIKETDRIINWYSEKFNRERLHSFKSGDKFFNCGIGLGIGIESKGEIYPCFWATGNYGNIKTITRNELHNLLLNFKELHEKTNVENIQYCSDCELKFICTGGCKAKNYQGNGSYCKPHCNDSVKDSIYYSLIYNL
jgi:radical SAM protein with 4Fe4S-binding SPASM domain